MKYIFLLLLFCIVFPLGACAQLKVVDFHSAMVSVPVDNKTSITDVIYREGKFDTIQEHTVKGRKFKYDNRNDVIGTIIDDAQLVNYKSDTLYVLSTHYIPDTSVTTIIKTRMGTFDFIYNADGGYSLCSLENSYANIPEYEKISDFLLYEAIFTWNINLLVKLIRSSGDPLGSEYFISATRIILKENQVLKKDIINFEPALRWHLE